MKTKLSVFCNRVIEAGWLAAIVGVPLFFNIYTARTFEPDKITLMRSIVTVMIFAWLIKLIEQGLTKSDTSFRERFIAWLKRPMIFPTLLISIIYIISTAFSISPAVSFWGSYQRLQGTYTFLSYMVIFAMMVANMTTREQVDRFITTVIITSVPVALYGIIQKNGLDPLPWAGDVQKRVASNMGNAIFVASYLIMIIPITISRLVTSMKRMITSETHSWANTFLASTYIFVLAIQVITVIYSKSRGPQLGLLGAGALIGLLFLILLRQKADDKSMLSVAEVGQGLGFVAILGIATAILGGIGFGVGKGLESMLAIRWEVDGIYLFFAAVGTLMGFIGVYVYFAIRNQGWRWMWISWPIIGVMAIVFILALNGLMGDNPYLDKLRQVPYLGRLGQITDTEGGTGKVRVLIWEGVIELIKPHEPLGVEGEFDDDFNIIRPLIGYGPESMFNAFAYVYPPELAQVEARGSSADRSHNETMDSLAMTGIYGFIAFYLLMGSLFFYALKWLGWVPTRQSAMWLIGIMSACGLIGALIPYFIQGDFVLSAVGLPYGLFAGLVMYLCGQAFMGNTEIESKPISTTNQILLIGLLSAFLGHFLEVHFVFSIAATYTYFWAYLGLMVAMSRIAEMESEKKELVTIPNVVPKVEEKTHEKPRGRRRRGRSRNDSSSTAAWGAIDANGETWQMWTGSQGLTMAIILIILIFNFVTVQFDPTHGGYSFWWMTGITFLVGFSITVSSAANKIKDWHGDVSLVAVGGMYVITALSYAGLYAVVHGQQRASIQRGAADVITSANKVVGMLNGFYIALFLLMLIIGFTLVWGQLQGLQTWQMDNWWLYPPLILIMLVVISMKNIDVVKADIYLKEGERFRGAKKWDSAIRVHKESISVDRDEDFYYLMLALDYQLKAQDNKLTQEQRMSAWNEGERIALRAREINLYNPDNTGNMGRYYFTLAQVKSPEYYNDAIDFFEKAIDLAPGNVQYYNLLAKVHYIQRDYDEAVELLEQSKDLDDTYIPTLLDLGDTFAATGNITEALIAHTQSITNDPFFFADGNFDNRLNFYLSSGKHEDIIEAFEIYIEKNEHITSDAWKNRLGKANWAIGHIYLRAGELDKSHEYINKGSDLGYNDVKSLIAMGDSYLSQKKYIEAEEAYLKALEKNPKQAQIYSSLGYIYAQTGRVDKAIESNNKVLEIIPKDFDSNKNLAILYQQTGQLDKAIEHAKVARDVAPEEGKENLDQFISQLEAILESNN